MIDQPPVRVIDTLVERVHVPEERGGAVEEAEDPAEFRAGLVQTLLDLPALELERVHAVADLGSLEDPFRGEVDEVRLFRLDRLELLLERAAEGGSAVPFLVEGAPDAGAEFGREALFELLVLVHAGHGFFGLMDGDVGSVAGAFLSATAEEVEVLVPLAHRAGDDHSVASTFAVAPAAEQRPAQVMSVDAAALVRGRPGLQHRLDTTEELRRDERLVAANEAFAVVGDEADVVRIAE